MKNGIDEAVIERLRRAIEAKVFPKTANDFAEHLYSRLSKPVRVTVFGPPAMGKSELVNMIVGRSLLSGKVRLPTTEVVHGPKEAMTLTLADGSVQKFDGIDLAKVKGHDVAFLQLELPADILQRISLLEVVTDGEVSELASATDWAQRRTDIALWCTQVFDADEKAIWSRVPDSLKDHAFLVLTKADVLSVEKVLSKRVAALETVVAEEFHSLFAVATLQAVASYRKDGSLDESMYHASGGGALTSEVLRHAERGRRADLDSAEMFLARYKVPELDDKKPAKAAKPKVVEPEPEAPAEVVEIAEPAPAPKETKPEAAKQPAEKPVTKPAPTPAPAMDLTAATLSNPELFTKAVRFLKRRGESLETASETLSEGNTKPLFDQCVQAVEHLLDMFTEDDSGCESADDFIDELSEAQDLMVLLQMEGGDAPVVDAVTLLLQLRRDLEMKLAA